MLSVMACGVDVWCRVEIGGVGGVGMTFVGIMVGDVGGMFGCGIVVDGLALGGGVGCSMRSSVSSGMICTFVFDCSGVIWFTLGDGSLTNFRFVLIACMCPLTVASVRGG